MQEENGVRARTSRLAFAPALAALVVVAGGCRAWESYVPLTPPSSEWTHDPDDPPDEFVWRADGLTIRAYAASGEVGHMCPCERPETPRHVCLTVVVTNETPDLIIVTVTRDQGDEGAVYSGGWITGGSALLPASGERHQVEFGSVAFELPPRAPAAEAPFQYLYLVCDTPKGEPLALERHLPFGISTTSGPTQTRCDAHFVAHGLARDYHWYTTPLDLAVDVFEFTGVVIFFPLALQNGFRCD